jgi:hypothetical protein
MARRKFSFPKMFAGYQPRHSESEHAGRYRRGYPAQDLDDPPAGRHRARKAPQTPPRGRHRAEDRQPPPFPTRTAWERLTAGETVHGYRLQPARR